MSQTIFTVAVWVIPILFAITLHEAAHGWVANKLGDPTAKNLGRITANPIKHIDPVGTVILPLVLVMLSGFVIGWAKPVPVDMRHFKSPHLDMAIVALAGPASNLLMACGWALLALISGAMFAGSGFGAFMVAMGGAGITINLILMVLNLLPIPPLDGGRVVAGVMPPQMAATFMKVEPYGLWIIILLLVMGVLGKILWPMVIFFEKIITTIFML